MYFLDTEKVIMAKPLRRLRRNWNCCWIKRASDEEGETIDGLGFGNQLDAILWFRLKLGIRNQETKASSTKSLAN